MLALEGLVKAGGDYPLPSFAQRMARELRELVGIDSDLSRTGMLGTEPELFSAIDRQRAESELRFGLIPPILFGMGAVLFSRVAPWTAVLAGLVAVLLATQARSRLLSADRRLVQALRLGRAKSPNLDRVDAAAAAVRAAFKAREHPLDADSQTDRDPESPEPLPGKA